MGWWEAHVVPRLVDAALGGEPITRLRAQTCAGLAGRVLEVGYGSGLNLPLLPAEVTALDAVEPSELAWSRSAARREAARVPVRRIGLDGQRIAVADDEGGYDAALITFSLCTIPDPVQAVREVARLVRPGGEVHVLEHGLAPDAGVARWQRRLEPVQRRVAGGCHLTREPIEVLADGGLEVRDAARFYLAKGPARVMMRLTQARAVVPA